MYYEVLAVITMSITFYFIYYQSSPSYSPFHVVMVTMSVDYFLHFSSLVAYFILCGTRLLLLETYVFHIKIYFLYLQTVV